MSSHAHSKTNNISANSANNNTPSRTMITTWFLRRTLIFLVIAAGLCAFYMLTATPAASGNKVIVVFKEGTPASEIDAAVHNVESQGGKISHRYNSALLGFAAEMPDGVVSVLHKDPSIDYIEPDGHVSIYTQNMLKANK